jgi:hypothetical protein
MLIGDFDDLLEATPFTPFDLVRADGRALRVRSPEFAWHPPGSVRTIWVARDSGGGATLVDLHDVTQVVVGGRASNGRKRPRAGH